MELLKISVSRVRDEKLYIVVMNRGCRTAIEGIHFSSGISHPVSGGMIKKCFGKLSPSIIGIYEYPCIVERLDGRRVKVFSPPEIFPAAEKTEPKPVVEETCLPSLPDLNSIVLPDKLPKEYLDLLDRYKRVGRGWVLK